MGGKESRKPGIRIQTKFTEDTEHIIRKDFEVADDERLVSGVWLGAGKQGFVFTDKRFYWNLATVVERQTGVQHVNVPSNILQRNIKDLEADILYAEDGPEAGTARTLQLTSPIGKIQISLPALPEEDSRPLRSLFVQYLAYGQFPRSFGTEDGQDAVNFAIGAVADFVNSSKAVPLPPGETPSLGARIRGVTGAAVDTAADLIFAIAVMLTVKPILLYKTVFRPHTPFSDMAHRLGGMFFLWDRGSRQSLVNMEISESVIDLALYRRNYMVALLMAAFVCIKLAVVLVCCHGRRKALPLTLVLLTLGGITLACNHFLLFLLYMPALYLVMQLALRLPWEVSGSKLLVLLVMILVCYYILHLFGYPNFAEIMAVVLQRMTFPAAW